MDSLTYIFNSIHGGNIVDVQSKHSYFFNKEIKKQKNSKFQILRKI